jgi:hypothetical protein
MLETVVRDLQLLWKADSLIGRMWLNVMARRFGFFALAGLVAVFGLGMANVAGFYGLEQFQGPVWAAAIVAIADLFIALIIALLGRNVQPGPEIELAFEVRRMALTAVASDARDVKLTVDQTRATIAGYVQHPLNAATEHLLVPAIVQVLRGLRSKKHEA